MIGWRGRIRAKRYVRCVSAVNFASVSPIVPVRDLDVALGRHRRLGFDARAYVDPDGTLHRVGSRLG
ncbi:hypothetical protein A5682_11195 [Mycobacterium mantenii]|uniref:Uncharacterized protein n=1 Tax=Mycobacterium mantenii TaxID=560555 RepID=A0A1A2SPR3_MYCNT|nr:hypothetical protein A5688_04005 [Mycobacterium mantenii]OBH51640.1 hypothetical protein A5687_10215 [Mycobacterium mantenii]OBH66159.1 hypothetical protein A5683_00975 [Mycobacterium mantenii]OBH69267.1 hypothetical protein A5682_11195 [Mycobacterium mantenii]